MPFEAVKEKREPSPEVKKMENLEPMTLRSGKQLQAPTMEKKTGSTSKVEDIPDDFDNDDPEIEDVDDCDIESPVKEPKQDISADDITRAISRGQIHEPASKDENLDDLIGDQDDEDLLKSL